MTPTAEFSYFPSKVTPTGRQLDKDRLVTRCTLRHPLLGYVVARGEAMLNPKEPFDVDIARAVACGRAMKDLASRRPDVSFRA